MRTSLSILAVVGGWLVPSCPGTTLALFDSSGQAAYNALVKTQAGTDFNRVTCPDAFFCGAAGMSFTGFLNEGQHADISVANFDGVTGRGNALQGPGYNDGRSFLQLLLSPGGSGAFSLDLFSIDPALGAAVSTPVVVQLYRGTTLLETLFLNTGSGSPVFLGVISDLGITEVRLYAGRPDSVLVVDDVNYGDVAPASLSDAPEAATVISCAGGLLLLLAFGRRHRSAAAAS